LQLGILGMTGTTLRSWDHVPEVLNLMIRGDWYKRHPSLAGRSGEAVSPLECVWRLFGLSSPLEELQTR